MERLDLKRFYCIFILSKNNGKAQPSLRLWGLYSHRCEHLHRYLNLFKSLGVGLTISYTHALCLLAISRLPGKLVQWESYTSHCFTVCCSRSKRQAECVCVQFRHSTFFWEMSIHSCLSVGTWRSLAYNVAGECPGMVSSAETPRVTARCPTCSALLIHFALPVCRAARYGDSFWATHWVLPSHSWRWRWQRWSPAPRLLASFVHSPADREVSTRGSLLLPSPRHKLSLAWSWDV